MLHRFVMPVAILSLTLLLSTSLHAQSPWTRAADNMAREFTGQLGYSLVVIAIVLVGVLFSMGDPHAKERMGHLVIGGGLALFAPQFLTWLF